MGVIENKYRVIIETNSQKNMSHPLSMIGAIEYTLDYLSNIHAAECIDNGEWIITQCACIPNTLFCKRYVIIISIPYTKITIKKESRGSIPKDMFNRAIKIIKEDYYEGI